MSIIVIAAAVFALVATYGKIGPKWLYASAKPFPLVILIVYFVYVVAQSGKYPFVPVLIGAGLVLGLLGDIFLINEKRFFLPGLVSFLSGHICYVIAFAKAPQGAGRGIGLILLVSLAFIPFIGFFVIFVKAMEKSARKQFLAAIALYFIVIGAMFVSAISLDIYRGASLPLYAIGAVLFCISDSILAWTLFVKETKVTASLVLIAYFSAQIFIAVQTIQLLPSF